MKRFLAVLLLMLSFLLPAAAEEEPELLILLYMTGSNLETEGGAASRDLTEIMEYLPEDGSVQVLALLSGSREWEMDVSEGETSVYRVSREGLFKVRPGSLTSMGRAETLSDFLNWAYDTCPAKEYALILWDHGGGPVLGVCFDELFEGDSGMDSLTLAELSRALADSPFAQRKLSWIGFDACLMASVETACAVAPYAGYMIASQELEPGEGWNYAFLVEAAGLTGEETGRRIVDCYREERSGSLASATLSVTDLSRMEDVAREMTAFFGGVDLTRDSYGNFARSRVDTKAVACSAPVNYDLVDLMDLLDVLGESGADCGSLMEALREAVVCNWSNTPFLNGLSLYYPFYNKGNYVSPWASLYQNVDFSSGYTDFLGSFTKVWLGESLTDWNSTHVLEQQARETSAVFTLQLPRQQLEQLAEARLVVLGRGGWGMNPDNYFFVYSSRDVSVSESGLLAAAYQGQCLAILGENGEPLTGAITYEEFDGGIGLRVVLSRGEILDPDWDSAAAYLIYAQDEEGNWTLTRALRLDDDEAQAGRRELDMSEWDEVSYVNGLRDITRDENGGMRTFDEWERPGRVIGYYLTRGEDFTDFSLLHPAFIPMQDTDYRYAYLEMRDLQNNVTCTELYSMDNPNRQRLTGGITLMDNEYVTLTLDWAELVTGLDNKIDQQFTAVNHTGDALTVKASDIYLNDVYAPGQYPPSFDLEPGQTLVFNQPISPKNLRDMRCSMLDEIRVTLNVYREEEALCREPVTIPMRVDTRALADVQPDRVLASAPWPGMDVDVDLVQIIRDEGNTYPYFRTVFRFTSRRDDPVRFGIDALYINGIGDFDEFRSLDDGFVDRWWTLPPHCTAYFMAFRDLEFVECPVETIHFYLETTDGEDRRAEAVTRDKLVFVLADGEGE